MEKILIVEDEKEINDVVNDYFSSLGYETFQCFNGTDAIKAHEENEYDLIILDLMMPGIDGIETARRIRQNSQVPILMLTARDSEADKVLGLEIGADAYMTKPFSIRELGAQVRAILRRWAAGKGDAGEQVLLSHRDIELDITRRSVSRNGVPVKMTTAQFDLLAMLMKNPGRVYTRGELIEALSGYQYEGYERTIDVQIKNLRKVLEDDPSHPDLIQTVWGVGYKVQE